MKTTNITIKISPELKDKFMEYCKQNCINASELLRKHIENMIKNEQRK